MKKTALLLACVLASVVAAQAEVINGQCSDEIAWSYDTESKVLTLTGEGSIPDYGPFTKPWEEYKNEIESIVLPIGLTHIGAYAFHSYSAITSITIPANVVLIDQYSFQDCVNLNTCSLPDGLLTIGSHAFAGCYSLTSLAIPASVTEVRYNAFYLVPNIERQNTNSLDGARCLNGVVDGYWVFTNADKHQLAACSAVAEGAVTIPAGVTQIQPYAGFHCMKITSLTLPDQVTTIGKYAFDECEHIERIVLGSGIADIGMYGLSCKGLKTVVCRAVTVPDASDYAFYASHTDQAVLYVPAESIEAYKAASPWKNFGTVADMNEEQAIDLVETKAAGRKLIRNGHIFIECDGKTYNALGQPVQ